ncbi:MAG: hypothetical protein KGS61_21680, partial [Verrucomicrobia bacterium]|nr:hypothetical protein [Verrucomicrobiota bacterium]
IVGVIMNKVLGEKVDYISDFARRGLKRKGLDLLGVIPLQPILCKPTMDVIRDELQAQMLNAPAQFNGLVDEVVLGSMGVHNAINYFKHGVLLITAGDREDILLAVASTRYGRPGESLAGIILTRRLRPGPSVLKAIQEFPFPVLLVKGDSYEVASRVHDLTVKTRAHDTEKISLIRDLIAKHVDVQRILKAL